MGEGTALPGGAVSGVVRVGDTVRRVPTANTAYVRELLGLLADRGWPGAPRWRGVDERGREMLDFVEGHVAWEPGRPAALRTEQCLAAVARLVRELHDLTAGTRLAGDQEVVCHNDLAPRNTVYRDGGAGLRPVAFIDWDAAAPGARIHDVAHVCWQYLDLGPTVEDVTEAARLIGVIAAAYGLADRSRLVPAVLWWQDRCRRGIEAAAEGGDPAMIRLCARGVPDQIRADHAWTRRHAAVLSGQDGI
ncbi:phosphotransferase [Catellatospora sp. NPDC049609]|uniref:phosphotransferase n=1 Tax=Catellatospora sp. NPDC049609 TaxID=3155505 RepID=UPI00344AE488